MITVLMRGRPMHDVLVIAVGLGSILVLTHYSARVANRATRAELPRV